MYDDVLLSHMVIAVKKYIPPPQVGILSQYYKGLDYQTWTGVKSSFSKNQAMFLTPTPPPSLPP